MNDVEIRPADAEEDAAACAAIYAPYVAGAATSFEETPPGETELARRIAAAAERHAWLVAVLEGKVVGFAYAGPHRGRPSYRWSVEVSVYVEEAHHGAGAGRALYTALLERLRARGFRTACAGITLPNEASVALHEGLGFTPIGTYQKIGWKAGAWRDVGWWQLQLAPQGDEPPPEPH